MTVSSNGSSGSSTDRLGSVYQLQKTSGVERKRRSGTLKDQPTANKPGQPYQKDHPRVRANPSKTQPMLPDPFPGAPPFYSKPPLPRTTSDEGRLLYSSTTPPSQCSLPSSPYHPSAGTPSSPGPRNVSPLQESPPMHSLAFDHFQSMGLTPQSTPDSPPLSSPGYHGLQSYSHELPGERMLRHRVSPTVSVDESHLAVALVDDIYALNCLCWDGFDGQQGYLESPICPHSLAPYPPASTDLIPPTGNPNRSYFYLGHEDHATFSHTQNSNISLPTNRSFNVNSPTTVPYYSGYS